MARLTTRDYQGILEFCQGLYSSLDVDTFVNTALARLLHVIPCEAITYNEMCPSDDSSRDVDYPSKVLGIDNWPHVMGDHPVLEHLLRTGDMSTAYKVSDFITRRQLRETGLYDEVYKVAGVESGLCIALAIAKTPRPVIIGIGLHRGKADFSERDRLVMNLLLPHLAQAYRNAVAVSRLGRALDGQGRAMIALDPNHRIRFITKRAQAWLAEYLGWTGGEGSPIPIRVDEWLRIHLLESAEAVPTPREPLVLRDGSRRLVIRLLDAGREPVLEVDEQRDDAIPTAALQRLNLSPRESDVLAWMALGKTNGEIAQIVGVSRRTVEKHCENIYQKLGVESRTAAVRRALEVVPQLVQFQGH